MTGAGIAGPELSVAWISRKGGLGSPRSLEIILKGALAA
jgi:hypothetical protein